MNTLEMDIEKSGDKLEQCNKVQRQKEIIINRLRQKGFRFTNQRKIIIDILLQNECDSCKQIYYKAIKKDEQIGIATVYRVINILEEIGIINKREMYKVVDLESMQQLK